MNKPSFMPMARKAMTIGISQSWYCRKGAYGAGIFGPATFIAIVNAVNIMSSESVFVFIFPRPPVECYS
jgi:hypothetical protein